MSPDKASLDTSKKVRKCRPYQNDEMYSNVGEQDANESDSDLSFQLRIWNKICEAHTDIDEKEVRAFVLSLFPKI